MGCQPSKSSATTVEEFDVVAVGGGAKKALRGADFHEAFELRSKLGQGAQGTVYSALGTAGGQDGRAVAVKVIDLRVAATDPGRGTRQRLAMAKEVSILGALPKSAHLVEFHGAYLADSIAYLVMEKCEMGLWPAFLRLPSLTEETLRPVLRDMMSAVAACHQAGVAHRDVKPDNFLVVWKSDSIVPKLCDFGLSTRVSSAAANELIGVCGTPPFMAPEVLGWERYNATVDVWAIGVLAHVLVFGRWPYDSPSMTVEAMKAAIRTGVPKPSFKPGRAMPEVSKSFTRWVRTLLCRCSASRPSAKEALLDDDLSATWNSSSSLSSALQSAWECGAFEGPVGEKGLTELDRHVARLNVARNMHSAPTRATWFSDEAPSAASSKSPSTDPWQAAEWSCADSGDQSGV